MQATFKADCRKKTSLTLQVYAKFSTISTFFYSGRDSLKRSYIHNLHFDHGIDT
jgi:hypothetical protein